MLTNLVCHSLVRRTIPLAFACLFCLCAYGSAQEDQPGVPRIESVRMAYNQPQEDSPALIWFDDFDNERQYTESSGPTLDATSRFGNYGKAMRCFYAAGQQGTGNRKVFFGDHPHTAISRDGEKFEEIYWRIYVKHQAGWTGGGPAKMSRATSMVSPSDWRQMMISHVWAGSGGSLTLDPASGVDKGGSKVKTTTYNDFANLRWLGNNPVSEFKISSTEESGWWVCVEARVKLNTPGLSDGENQLWIDGKLEAERLNLDWRGSYSNYGINAVFLEAYWNGGSPVDQNRWYDNFVISTSPIGPVTTGRNPEIFKTPWDGTGSQAAWEAQISLDRDGRHLVWSSNPVTDGDSVVVGTVTGTFSGRLAGENKLAPGTKYYFRARQQNDIGQWSDWSYWHQEILTDGEAEPQGMGCDFNEDGRVGVADALALMIFQMRHPADPVGDYNGDGETGLADVVTLLTDIMTGFCSGGQSLLASSDNADIEAVLEMADLSRGEGERLRESLSLLGLDREQARKIETALERSASLPVAPEPFSLLQNHPNPFNPQTTISFSLPEFSGGKHVSLKVFDLRNKLVRNLIDRSMPSGTHTVTWDGTDEQSNPVANGIYLYRMQANSFVQTRKMVLLR
jgi:hypothetical protein